MGLPSQNDKKLLAAQQLPFQQRTWSYNPVLNAARRDQVLYIDDILEPKNNPCFLENFIGDINDPDPKFLYRRYLCSYMKRLNVTPGHANIGNSAVESVQVKEYRDILPGYYEENTCQAFLSRCSGDCDTCGLRSREVTPSILDLFAIFGSPKTRGWITDCNELAIRPSQNYWPDLYTYRARLGLGNTEKTTAYGITNPYSDAHKDFFDVFNDWRHCCGNSATKPSCLREYWNEEECFKNILDGTTVDSKVCGNNYCNILHWYFIFPSYTPCCTYGRDKLESCDNRYRGAARMAELTAKYNAFKDWMNLRRTNCSYLKDRCTGAKECRLTEYVASFHKPLKHDLTHLICRI